MWILKDTSCERCGGTIIAVIPHTIDAHDTLVENRVRKEDGSGIFRAGDKVVNGATCQDCFKEVILPSEYYFSFVREHCKRIS